MKLKNLIFVNGGSMKTCSAKKTLNFSPGYFALDMCIIVITHPVPHATDNYKLHLLVHTGMK